MSCDYDYPARVDAAFETLRWASEAPVMGLKEDALYNAALEVIRLYLSGEMEFANPQSTKPEVPESQPKCFFCDTERKIP